MRKQPVDEINAQPPRPEHKPPVTDDDLFFHKGQVSVGARLIHQGRLDPGSVWEVTGITPMGVTPSRKKTPPQQTVHHLSDQVLVRRVGSNESRQVSFSYLSYSAIWRLS